MKNLKQAYFLFILILLTYNQNPNNKLLLISMFNRMLISDWLFVYIPIFLLDDFYFNGNVQE